jgi:hypothetical protein
MTDLETAQICGKVRRVGIGDNKPPEPIDDDQALNLRESETPKPWQALGMSRATWYRHGKPTERPWRLSIEQAAMVMNVSVRSIESAQRVIKFAPELEPLIMAGKLKLHRAEEIIDVVLLDGGGDVRPHCGCRRCTRYWRTWEWLDDHPEVMKAIDTAFIRHALVTATGELREWLSRLPNAPSTSLRGASAS